MTKNIQPAQLDPVDQIMRLVDSYKDAQAQRKYPCLPKIRAVIEEAVRGLQSTPADAIAKDQAQRARVAKALGLDSRTNWAWSYLRQQIEALKGQVPTGDQQGLDEQTRQALQAALACMESDAVVIEAEFGRGRTLAKIEEAGELDPAIIKVRSVLAVQANTQVSKGES